MKQRILITAGRGPEECTRVVAKTLKSLLKEAEKKGIETQIIQHNPGSINSTVRSVVIDVKGKHALAFAKEWEGSILWIGQSPYRKFHKRKNWFIEVFILQNDNNEAFDERDVYYQSTRSSGPGGQHVNKTSTAIRAVHGPTGISVLAQDARSQYQNKKSALNRLREKFELENNKSLAQNEEENWMKGLEIKRGNPIKTFEGRAFVQKN